MGAVRAFATDLQQTLLKLMRNYESCDEMCVAQHGITATQGYTLLAFPNEADLSMNELSEQMGLASSTMTRMVDHLVRKGLVGRQHDEDDRRVVRVSLTSEGKRLRQELERERQQLMETVLEAIPEAERPVILRSLDKVASVIAQVMAHCCHS